MTQTLQAALELPTTADLGEGAIWHPERNLLHWIDINGCQLHTYNPETQQDKSIPTGAKIGTVVPVSGSTDVLAALQTGIHRINTTTGEKKLMVDPITDPLIRFNDGKCDPSGRFWVGTIHLGGMRKTCALYRFDGNGSLRTMLDGVSNSNGIVWTSDRKTMYYIDTPTQCVQAFDYDDQSGDIANRRIALSIPKETGAPDGMSIDSADNLWIAMWGGGAVNCYNPQSGELLVHIAVPAPHTTSCAFGGPGLKTLFITSARAGLSPEELDAAPASGGLFSVALNIAGVPSIAYRAL